MRKKRKVHIKKEDFPKVRRLWKRKPATQVTPSKKTYKRSRTKSAARKMIKNELRKKNR